ncbi:MAG: Segregation and condensation protein B [Actinobacteria bacterium ADurb.Bin444]|nr:MAG: Segregation and condensation protein B [Actinobacteria bacterium ADurb.Bin444]
MCDERCVSGDGEFRRDLEALLFAAGRPLTIETLMSSLSVGARQPTIEVLEEALRQLEAEFPVDGPRGFEVTRVAEGWCMRTNRLAERVLSGLFDTSETLRLSPAAYETLAVVAYLQPVARRQIAEIRGVNSDSSLRTLLERELIQEVGRAEQVGQAVLYGTTERFLLLFGLRSLAELTPLESFEVPAEERAELLRRLGSLVAPE